MTPSRPYLFRAINEWLLDNGMTPYILVDATVENTYVPQHFVTNDEIVLNISPESVQNLSIDNAGISFNARFRGQPFDIYVPMQAVQSIYAKENGKGMMFDPEEYNNEIPPAEKKPAKPHLRIVK